MYTIITEGHISECFQKKLCTSLIIWLNPSPLKIRDTGPFIVTHVLLLLGCKINQLSRHQVLMILPLKYFNATNKYTNCYVSVACCGIKVVTGELDQGDPVEEKREVIFAVLRDRKFTYYFLLFSFVVKKTKQKLMLCVLFYLCALSSQVPKDKV